MNRVSIAEEVGDFQARDHTRKPEDAEHVVVVERLGTCSIVVVLVQSHEGVRSEQTEKNASCTARKRLELLWIKKGMNKELCRGLIPVSTKRVG